jgi:hypothetical protein
VSGFAAETSDFGLIRLAVACAREGRERQVLAHELAHLFSRIEIGAMPAWVDEGLATYLQEIEVADGDVRVGAPVPGEPSLGVADLLAIDRETVWDEQARGGHYASAWHLVHLLFDDDQYRPRFEAYLRAHAAGTAPEAAWAGAFEGVRMDDLEQDFGDHLVSPQVRVRGLPIGEVVGGEVATAPLGLDDVLDTWMGVASAWAAP